MLMFYLKFLQELPKMSRTDVHRICRLTSKTATKMDKGFMLHASYICDYEGMYLLTLAVVVLLITKFSHYISIFYLGFPPRRSHVSIHRS